MVDSSKVIEIIRAIGFSMEEHKEELTALDQPIGDSDHGINLARGFEAVEKKLPELEGKDIGTILKTVGMTLVSTVGGASGPLYGSAYMKAGMALAGKKRDRSEGFPGNDEGGCRRRDAARQGGRRRGNHAGCNPSGT
uniref:DAK2 domain-containing protein n=1 Tax=Clostridium sp. NkU-1 TaxID=1095009 RepID=UPI000A48D29B